MKDVYFKRKPHPSEISPFADDVVQRNGVIGMVQFSQRSALCPFPTSHCWKKMNGLSEKGVELNVIFHAKEVKPVKLA